MRLLKSITKALYTIMVNSFNRSMNNSTLLVALFITSCSTHNKTPEASVLTPHSKAKRSAILLKILKSSGLPSISSDETTTYRAFDVGCYLDPQVGKYQCQLYNKLPLNKATLYKVPQVESDQLSEILFDLPVSKGDSGASTPFVECRTNKDDQLLDNSCDIAITLDHPGP